ncbi:hypothetical protein HYALB_00011700 [Hymenoscyphus albidus]|uniref:ABC transporter domain-containing protein n=1 Tax=Hymenoscyphus albidus TaxID=595503 RepID=A0A9N9LM66_9HELO|nr:hypothetical protein HYALB_00011700 [Hymenoscyphus albidus]
MLGIDFETLPIGDASNVGSNGITLSGGQRQRVSLARALYLQTDLLIFDDVFSGLDANTEDQVFRRVFGLNGIIRRRHATAVLCTHSRQLFSLARAVLRKRMLSKSLAGMNSNTAIPEGGGILLLDEVSSSVDQET